MQSSSQTEDNAELRAQLLEDQVIPAHPLALARNLGYDCGLLSLAALREASIDELIEHAEAVAIFETAERYAVPVFSSSSLYYIENAQAIRHGKISEVVGR